MFSPTSLLDNYAIRIRGSADSFAITQSIFTTAEDLILYGRGGAGVSTTLDINGEIFAAAASTSPANFGNQIVNLGSRNNGASAPFGGRVYAMIAVAGLVSEQVADAVQKILARNIPSITFQTPCSPSNVKLRDAMYSWWNSPLVQSEVGRTGWAGITNASGNISVVSAATSQPVVLDTKPVDDHIAPAILDVPGKPPLAFWTDRTGTKLFWKKGTTSGDFTTLGTTQELENSVDVDYQAVFNEPGTDNIFVFSRHPNMTWVYAKSTDYADTFAAPVQLLTWGASGLAYITFAQVGNVLRCAAYTHPVLGLSTRTIYFFTINLTSDASLGRCDDGAGGLRFGCSITYGDGLGKRTTAITAGLLTRCTRTRDHERQRRAKAAIDMDC
jgi:hypothetical protein